MTIAPLSIVHVISSPAFAGVERHVALLAAGQARVGHRVTVIGGEPQAMHAALDPDGVVHREAATVVEAIRALGRFRHSQIVHAHMTAAEVAAAAVRLPGRALVATRHFARLRGSSRSGRLVAPIIARRVDAQIAISAYVAGAIDGPSTVVHPGVAEAPLVPADRRRRTVLVAQRLEAEKRTEDAIAVFAGAGLADRGWRLAIAGDGAQRARLERLAADRGIAAATDFLGYRTDVPDLMHTAGLLLAPCDVEGLGLTVLEAMASGLPVVACGAGGHLETAGAAADAALYARGDLAAGALRLRDLALDEAARHTYGGQLREVQRTGFTVRAQVEGTDAVYRGVL